jgi:hypothetical protein
MKNTTPRPAKEDTPNDFELAALIAEVRGDDAAPPSSRVKHRVWVRVQQSIPDGSESFWGDRDYELTLSPDVAGGLWLAIGTAVSRAKSAQRAMDQEARRGRSSRGSR